MPTKMQAHLNALGLHQTREGGKGKGRQWKWQWGGEEAQGQKGKARGEREEGKVEAETNNNFSLRTNALRKKDEEPMSGQKS